MTPAAELLANEIARHGPLPFAEFMRTALYHPLHGYYRRPRDPFGKGGDFYTAEQIQPVFGILIAARIRELYRAMGEPRDFTVVELGAGRGEMAEAFAEWRYVPVDVDSGALPDEMIGVVFSNEFFDALPVDAATYREGKFRRQCVAFHDGSFVWRESGEVADDAADYLRTYFPAPQEGNWYEINLAAMAWMDRIAHALRAGSVLTIDYGFRRAEAVRFPHGTLMGYRRHSAMEDVLREPGLRDITAHVNFTALEARGALHGLRTVSFSVLSQLLLAAGEADGFAAALGAQNDLRRRMQLKTLLFGMGETFRVLLQSR
ncbi:MAG TPA: SAM-dependent methyltransferase [Bryobacteraceae bacterium]|jgi:SAM-dependent MidA family methyltransferase|nr:SAM-dependent methyltransferase [Bryobacteraceae bacterium]